MLAMDLDHDACYRVLQARDRRFDGRPWRAYAVAHFMAVPLQCRAHRSSAADVVRPLASSRA